MAGNPDPRGGPKGLASEAMLWHARRSGTRARAHMATGEPLRSLGGFLAAAIVATVIVRVAAEWIGPLGAMAAWPVLVWLLWARRALRRERDELTGGTES